MNTKAHALDRLATAFTLLEGETLKVLVDEGRLLAPLSEALLDYEEAYNFEITIEAIED